jgi:hypothetical protein
MDKRFGLWNVRRLYRAGSLMKVSRKLSKYKLHLVGVKDVRWRAVAPNLPENTHSSTERGMRIISAVKIVEIVSDRMSYIIIRGRWSHIIVLNVRAPTEDETDV